jgi:hypothetical protein
MADISEGNPKQEILKDALKELHIAKLNLTNEKSVEILFAKSHITMAIHLLYGLLSTSETLEQTYHLD